MAIAAALVIAGGAGAFYMKSKKHAEPTHAKHDEHGKHDEHAKTEEHAEAPKHEEHGEHAKAGEHAKPASTGLLGRIGEAWTSVQDKVDGIRRLDLENSRLKLENAQLRLKLESANFECDVAQSKELTEHYAAQLKGETGSPAGRTLASISYRAPTHLLPKQLHTLGVTYLKARDYEKAAVIFTLLGDLPKERIYKTPAHQLLTGSTWFKLKNYDMAEFYFDQTLKLETDDALPYQAQARLWKSVIAHYRGKKAQSQFWMQELVDYHPRSPEARWVNPAAGVLPRTQALLIGQEKPTPEKSKTEEKSGERAPAESHH